MRSVCSEDSPSSQLKRKLPALEMELGWAGGALGFKKTLLYGGTIEVAMFELKANSYTANTHSFMHVFLLIYSMIIYYLTKS